MAVNPSDTVNVTNFIIALAALIASFGSLLGVILNRGKLNTTEAKADHAVNLAKVAINGTVTNDNATSASRITTTESNESSSD